MMGETELNANSDSREDVKRGSWETEQGRRGPGKRGCHLHVSPHTLSTCFPDCRPFFAHAISLALKALLPQTLLFYLVTASLKDSASMAPPLSHSNQMTLGFTHRICQRQTIELICGQYVQPNGSACS